MRFILTGLGNIGRNLLEILLSNGDLVRERYGLALQCVGVADSSGVAYAADGLDLAEIVALKRAGGKVAALAAFVPEWSPQDLAAQAAYDLLMEAMPTNLVDGQPGLDVVRTALQRGCHAVLASKGPLVLDFAGLAALSSAPTGPFLRFSGAVGGGLPSINIGRRDLAGARISRAELVLNGTSQVILEEIARGQSFEQALAEAQRQGIVEPDPALDVDGWDAANKLVIFANAVLGRPTTLADLAVRGIRDQQPSELAAAWASGGRISLVGLAEEVGGEYRLSVAPTYLPADHPLARLHGGEMGMVLYSDIIGRTSVASLEDGPIGSCQAMLRDAIEIAGLIGQPAR